MLFSADSAKKHGRMSVFFTFLRRKCLPETATHPKGDSPGGLKEILYKRQILQGMKP